MVVEDYDVEVIELRIDGRLGSPLEEMDVLFQVTRVIGWRRIEVRRDGKTGLNELLRSISQAALLRTLSSSTFSSRRLLPKLHG